MSQPKMGEFKDGRGKFFDQETLNGRAIFVRFVISDITPNSCRFEQAFSDDGGKTWEVNWIATETRVKDESEAARRSLPHPRTKLERQGNFELDFGPGKSHLPRLPHP